MRGDVLKVVCYTAEIQWVFGPLTTNVIFLIGGATTSYAIS